MINYLSVDLESFVHREFDEKKRTRNDNDYTRRTTEFLLDLLKKYQTKITFFVVGEIYNMYPTLIRKIKSDGHEIAYHSHKHLIIKNEDDLERDLILSKEFIDKYRPMGFRAPRMEMEAKYFKILKKYNFAYDSSVYSRFELKNINGIKEIPVSLFPYPLLKNKTLTFPSNFKTSITRGIPFGSGLFIALLGENIRFFIDYFNRNNLPCVLFFHPWQLAQYESLFTLHNIYNPAKVFYKKNITRTLEFLLSTYKFAPLKNLAY